MSTANPTEIICLGEPLIELNRQSDGMFRPGHGGDVANCAVAATRSGARAAVATRLGDDVFGDSFRTLWAAEGVDASLAPTDPDAPTGAYVVEHGPDGHRFGYLRQGSAASRFGPADVAPGAPAAAAIGAAKILHASGISQAISTSAADAVFAAIELARSSDTLVSYDTNLRLKLWPLARARGVIHSAVGMSDIVLPGDGDAMQLTGCTAPDAIVDFYLGLGPSIVALTLGAEGALVATPERRERIPAFTVKAIDATGAGDAFDGAFLAEIAAGRDPFAAARYANAAAALSTQGYGAVAPLPRRAEVEAFIAERSG